MREIAVAIFIFGMIAICAIALLDGLQLHITAVEQQTAQILEGNK